MEYEQKILIVDDKAENLFSLRKVLSETDAVVIEAASGEEALSATLYHDFALAILDVQMPEMDGYELAEYLRGDDKTRTLPIIFVSAVYSSEYHVFRGYQSGAVDFLVKPFDGRIILGKVNVFLELDRQNRELAASKIDLERIIYELKAAENTFESLVATVPDIVYRIGPDGRFTFINDSVRRLGYDPEELVGRHFSNIIMDAEIDRVSREKVIEHWKKSPDPSGAPPKLFDERRTGPRKTTGLEIHLIPKKGSENLSATLDQISSESVVVEINSAGLYSDRVESRKKIHMGTVGVIRDITERKKYEDKLKKTNQELEKRVAERTEELVKKNRTLVSEIELRIKTEEKLRDSKKEWQEMFEAIGHMAIAANPDHDIIAVNRSVEKHTGIPRQDLIGRKCFEVFHQSDKPFEKCPQEEYRKSGKRTATEMEIDLFNLNCILNCTPVYDKDGNLSKLIHIFTDITHRKNLEKDLIQAHKIEAIGTLAGGIAHDFNNILSALLGFTQLALKNTEPGSLMQEDLNEVLNCGYRARELVRQILTFARQSDETYACIHIDYIVKEVAKFLRSSIPTTIELETVVNSDSTIYANATQIHQVLMNLCSNASHAMKKEGGTLRILLEDVSLPPGAPELEKSMEPGDYLKLEVSDTGTGIEAEILEKIFEPYFTTKEQGEGTGMGLAVVQGIIKDIKGAIRIKTRMGQGTVFTVLIPVSHEEETAPAPEMPVSTSVGDEHILFVDDEPAITTAGRRMLEEKGYKVTAMNSSEEALEVFKKNPEKFDLVFTDMTMPGMTGARLIEKILDIRPELPVVMCSGYQKKEVLDENLKKRVNMFVQKPFDRDSLNLSIRKALDHSA